MLLLLMEIISNKLSTGHGMQSVILEKGKFTGRRITSQRRLLLDILNNAEGHLDADELYRRAKICEPHISLSTVYRTLKLFKELGMVQERHFTEEHHHYEVKPTAEHYHLICLGCGMVTEFESPQIRKIAGVIGGGKGFEVTGSEMYVEGYCPNCRKLKRD